MSEGSVGLITVLQQKEPKYKMPWVLCRWVSFSELSLPQITVLHVGACYGVCFLLSGSYVPARFTNRSSAIGYYNTTALQSLPLAGICAPGDALWPTPGVHWLTASSNSLSWGSFMLVIQLFHSHSIHIVGHAASGALQRVSQSLHLPYMASRGPLFQVVFHLVTWSAPNLWWALNLMIQVWWLGIRLMNLLTPGWQSILLLNYTFTLGSYERCQ